MTENMNMKPAYNEQGLSHCCFPVAKEEARSSGVEKDPSLMSESQGLGLIHNLCFFSLWGDGDGLSLQVEMILITDILSREVAGDVGGTFKENVEPFPIGTQAHVSSQMF